MIPIHHTQASKPEHVSWIGAKEYTREIADSFGGGLLFCPINYFMRELGESSSRPYLPSVRQVVDPRLDFARHFRGVPDPPVEISIGVGKGDSRSRINALATIGDRGFGYASGIRMPHWGNVIIGNDVHIGAFTTVHRGSLLDTIIASGAKIDAHVHVAHNCDIGKCVIICAGAVLCGSVKVGDRAFLGVNCSIRQGVEIGHDATIGMGAVVLHDVPGGETWAGNPARRIG